MVKKLRCSWRSFVVAALLSALASTLIVAVGPGFSSPNDNAADQAKEATEEVASTEVASTETTEETTAVTTAAVATPAPGQQPHSEAGNPNASSVPDTHGHVGSGTGTSTGSQSDPGHKEPGDPGYKPEDGANNGPGTGDLDAASCPNGKSSVNGDVDNGKGGANGSGPYDSTCDGDNSENGQGTAAPGKGTPCAGCVGNADDKQPPGQVKEFNGQKANDMGYECDGNQGVGAHYGRGNPAHTGDCDTTPTPVNVCRQVNGTWTIVSILPTQGLPGDKPAPSSGNAADCAVTVPVKVCRQNPGGQWHIVTILPGEGLPGDKPAPASGDRKDCEVPEVPTKVCRQNPGGQWHIVTILPGQGLPGDKPAPASGDRKDCEVPEVPTNVCRQVNGTWTIVSILPGQGQQGDKPAPSSGKVEDCEEDTELLCPVGSDKEGQPMPGGDIRRCYTNTPPPTTVCPAGTDRAGQPMPNGDIRKCNDDVLGGLIDKDKPDGDVLGNGAQQRPASRGRILPFTGASILAYLVLALELLGAGALILRARKR